MFCNMIDIGRCLLVSFECIFIDLTSRFNDEHDLKNKQEEQKKQRNTRVNTTHSQYAQIIDKVTIVARHGSNRTDRFNEYELIEQLEKNYETK
jgi:hypothetical protein